MSSAYIDADVLIVCKEKSMIFLIRRFLYE